MAWQDAAHPIPATDVEVGWWWTVCCEHDLAEITTPEQLAEARTAIDEVDTFVRGAWPTRAAAMADLLDR